MLYSHPDIRKQTLLDAEAHITEKRTRRMVLHYTAVEKQKAVLSKLHGADAEKFRKQFDRYESAMKKLDEAIDRVVIAIRKLHEINHSLANTESAQKEL